MVVLAAYAPSSQGDAALRAAVKEAFATSKGLRVASHRYEDRSEGLRSATHDEVLDALNRVSSTMSHEERAYLETLAVKVVESSDEDIDEFLIDSARTLGATLLVIGLRHSSRAGRMSLGSSVKRLLLSAPCPVLVAKDTDPATA